MQIAGRKIGITQAPYVIAEMSGNHANSLAHALRIVEAAAQAGAAAVKLQTYTPDTMTIDVDAPGFVIGDPTSPWAGRSLYDLYKEAHTPWDWHEPIMRHAAKLGLHCFSTPFDETAVDFLQTLEVPAYKIASFENTDIPLLKKVASTGKPLIISTGMASVGELDETVRAVREAGCEDFALLKCTSAYPAGPEDANIRTIAHLRELFGCEVGISDHTLGLGVAIAAVAVGATIVEKHLTLRRSDGGVDAAFSLEPAEFAMLAKETEQAWRSLGSVSYGAGASEKSSLRLRRSLHVVKDIKMGEALTRDNVRAIRPGGGLAPKFYGEVLGRVVKADIKRGTPLSWDLI